MRSWPAAAVGLLVLSTLVACGSERPGTELAALPRPTSTERSGVSETTAAEADL